MSNQTVRVRKFEDEVYANLNDLIIKLMVNADDAPTDLETQAIKKIINYLTATRDAARQIK